MRLITGDTAGTAWVTLPFEGPRSSVYSDLRESVSISTAPGSSPLKDSGSRLLSAAVAVLARYAEADETAVGICKTGKVAALAVATPADCTLGSLANTLGETLEWHSPETRDIATSPAIRSGGDRNPHFGVLVVLDAVPAPDLRQDVTLQVDPKTGKLTASYNVRLLRAEIVASFLGHVSAMLELLETRPATTIGAADYLGQAERTQLRSVGSGGTPACTFAMGDLIVEALARSGNTAVLETWGRSWTLCELMERADCIITGLPVTVRRGDRVGIALRPGADMIAALLATVRLSAVMVPLDTSLPAARLAAIREDSGLRVVIAECSSAMCVGDCPSLLVEALPDSAEVPCWPNGRPDANDPAYLLFTSGSTGRAKGVLVPHRTLANLIAWENARRPIAGKRTLGRTSIAFDVGLQETFASLLFGGVLVMTSDEERANVGALADLLKRHRIARVYLPPVALHQMAESAPLEPTGLDALEHVIVAGEQLRISPAVRRFFRATRARLVNQYGPTETHVATEFELDEAPLRWADLPSIGRPIAGIEVEVLDKAGHPVPLLVPGELSIGGIAPALEYVGQPALTASRFIVADDSRCYRTGDRVRWRLNGSLEFLGRADNQVKIRGYRVELADLESNAAALPGVIEVVAKAWKTEAGTSLALYFRLAPEALPLRDLRDMLRRRVPDYMLPPLHCLIELSAMPLSASGKIDRARLPEPLVGDTEADRTDLKGRLRGIWSRRLGIGQFDDCEDFRDLGGHSLMAIQIVSDVNDTFDIGMPLSTLLRGASLDQFAEIVQRLLAARDAIGAAIESVAPEPNTASRLTRVELPCGTVMAPSASEARHLWTEIYEQRACQPGMLKYLPGDVIVDVGANIGLFSRFALDMTGGCRLIAIEPAQDLHHCLSDNLAGRPGEVTVLRLGCGNEDIDGFLSYFPQVPAMSSFQPDRDRDRVLLERLLRSDPTWELANDLRERTRFLDTAFAIETQPCPMRRLSTLFSEFGLDRIDLLKVDVQRGEEAVLAGIAAADWARIRQVVVELQDDNDSVARSARLMKQHGMNVEVATIPLHRETNVRFIYAWRE
jgi:amino acid adenylation domain-containing protein/FkbM family methyltransferase